MFHVLSSKRTGFPRPGHCADSVLEAVIYPSSTLTTGTSSKGRCALWCNCKTYENESILPDVMAMLRMTAHERRVFFCPHLHCCRGYGRPTQFSSSLSDKGIGLIMPPCFGCFPSLTKLWQSEILRTPRCGFPVTGYDSWRPNAVEFPKPVSEKQSDFLR